MTALFLALSAPHFGHRASLADVLRQNISWLDDRSTSRATTRLRVCRRHRRWVTTPELNRERRRRVQMTRSWQPRARDCQTLATVTHPVARRHLDGVLTAVLFVRLFLPACHWSEAMPSSCVTVASETVVNRSAMMNRLSQK